MVLDGVAAGRRPAIATRGRSTAAGASMPIQAMLRLAGECTPWACPAWSQPMQPATWTPLRVFDGDDADQRARLGRGDHAGRGDRDLVPAAGEQLTAEPTQREPPVTPARARAIDGRPWQSGSARPEHVAHDEGHSSSTNLPSTVKVASLRPASVVKASS